MPLNRPSHEFSTELIREKCSDFADFHVWPLKQRLDPRGWLSNFSDDDNLLAHHLLNGFMYFSDELTIQLFVTALKNIALHPSWRQQNPADIFVAWPQFLQRLKMTYVTGEIPNPTDSGQMFTRKARDFANIDESQIQSPERVLADFFQGDRSPIVFVDDFVGSGNQFCETWERDYSVAGTRTSFYEVSNQMKMTEVYYAPAVCTATGLREINRRCPGVVVVAGNFLSDHYSLFHSDSLLWPDALLADGQEMITRVSNDLGIPSDENIWDYRGFHKLGLALGFSHKVPDATIPLFRWNSDDWHPLVKDV